MGTLKKIFYKTTLSLWQDGQNNVRIRYKQSLYQDSCLNGVAKHDILDV